MSEEWDGECPEWFEDEWDEEEDFYDDEYPCHNCGPWCPHWLGDGICELVVEEQARQWEEYMKKHKRKAKCPVCGKELEEYDVKAQKLWTWDIGWYDPLIALHIYGPYDIEKGVIHSKGNVYHIWVGDKKNQKLIRLIK